MKTGVEGKKLIKSFEALRCRAYQDSGGVWTVGYGSTGPHVKRGLVLTPNECETLLEKDLERFERAVNTYVTVPLNQNQFDALVSFAFNVGVAAFKGSTLVRLLNGGDYNSVPAQLVRWNKDNGKVLKGLTRRRIAEGELFMKSPPRVMIPLAEMSVHSEPPKPSFWARFKAWFIG